MALFGKIFIFCDFETDSFGFSCHDMKMEANEYSLGTNQKKNRATNIVERYCAEFALCICPIIVVISQQYNSL